MIIHPPGEAPVPACPPLSRVTSNALLQELSEAARETLWPHLQLVSLARGDVLAHVGKPVPDVYFIENGMVSLLRVMEDGRMAEVAVVGKEGLVDPCVLLGMDAAILDTIVHVPGQAWRLPRRCLLDLMGSDPGARAVLEHFVRQLFNQMAQNAACNRLHSLEKRCARWLLTAHDSAEADEFPLTQDYLASMLGAQRSSVAEVTAALRSAGHIAYRAGNMHILSRAGLRRAACECYRATHRRHT